MTLSTPVKLVALAALAAVLGLGGVLMLLRHSSSPSKTTAPPASSASQITVKVTPKPKKHPLRLAPGLPAVVRSALERRAVAVVAIYSSHNASDRSVLAEARDGAAHAHAAFIAANVALNPVAAGVVTWSAGPAVPAVLVVRRPGKVVFAVSGPTDSTTIAQAALTSK
jgi:hypothetical protein